MNKNKRNHYFTGDNGQNFIKDREPSIDISIEPLFNPCSVAIVGCSGDLSRLSGRPLKFLLDNNYKGQIYPINPKYNEINGIRCYPNIKEIPETVDVALLIVPASRMESVFQDCVVAKAKSAIIFSSGFAELGKEGQDVQEKIKHLSQKNGLPVLGPNCLGLINLIDSIPLSFSSVLEEKNLQKGDLALVSQSGAIAAYILGVAQEAKIGFSHWVTTGNEVSLDTFTVARYLLMKKEVKGVLVYLEESRNPDELIRAGIIAREIGKPLICLKVGRSQSGKRAALSHTGALAGSDEEYSACFRKAGIIEANHIEELLDLGVVLSKGLNPKGNRVAIMSISGGGGIICADRCEELGLEVPELKTETQNKLKDVIPQFGSYKNPIDLTAELISSPGLLKKSMKIILDDPDTDSIVLFLGGNKENAISLSLDIIEIVKEARKTSGKPILVSWMAAPSEAIEGLRKYGIPLLFDGVRTIKALSQLVNMNRHNCEYKAHMKDDGPTAFTTPVQMSSSYNNLAIGVSKIEKVKSMLISEMPSNYNSGAYPLSEYASKKMLHELGLAIPKGGLANTAGEAIKLAEHIRYPVVAKINSLDILHKSDIGALKIGINGPDALRKAFDEILENAHNAAPKALLNGIFIEEMVPNAIESIVGLRFSDKFGPVILFGAGGIFVELLKDTSLRLAPVNKAEALEMLCELKTRKLFSGFRGMAVRDIDAAVNAIVTISNLGSLLGRHLVELDINPLFILEEGNGIMVGDALMIINPE
ncbi:acetate--CoA ligase family protein [Desulfobacula sp.]|uniref:acetate--CoA ligase family protein n=1 Tax=Desulfobacula sp. TaxID=2593537 RepID=UPI0026210E24|nr:acetate--CoA ligase family protein [Desulfobacula sp.]